jgi:predicted RNA-binding protein with RPS1 domain
LLPVCFLFASCLLPVCFLFASCLLPVCFLFASCLLYSLFSPKCLFPATHPHRHHTTPHHTTPHHTTTPPHHHLHPITSHHHTITTTSPQQVVKGTITGLRNYGAFLELEGGTAGLLHISQISFDRIENLEQMFTIGQECKVMVIEHDKANGRVALSTKTLEANPGDMKKDMQAVFDNAEANAKAYHERSDRERAAREAAAKDIVAGLGEAGDASGDDALISVADSIENILASIVADGSEASQ